VPAARVAHQNQQLLRRLGPRRGLLHLASFSRCRWAPPVPPCRRYDEVQLWTAVTSACTRSARES
jgi:hypothetical protein